MHRKTRLKITDLNKHLTCSLCTGYLVDATSIIECLHSFCRSCIVRYLHTSKQCPICDTQVHKTRPLLNIRSDKTLQNLVYKLVPSMFKGEMKRRRDFYKEHPEASTSLASSREERGEMDEQELIIYTDDEHLSLSLEYYQQNIHIPKPKPTATLTRPVGNGDTASPSLSSSGSSCSDTGSESGSTADGGGAVGEGRGTTAVDKGSTSVTTGPKAVATSGKTQPENKSVEQKNAGNGTEKEADERLKGNTSGAAMKTAEGSGGGPINGKTRANGDTNGLSDEIVDKRYLRCPAAVSIGHIKKFIRHKFGLSLAYQIEVMYRGSEDELLPDDYTLMDVAYIYTWGRVGPLPLVYRVYQPVKKTPKRTLTDKNVPVIPAKVPKTSESTEEKNQPTVQKKDVSLNRESQENTSPLNTPTVPTSTAKSSSTSSVLTIPTSVVTNRT